MEKLNILVISSFYPPPWGACAVRYYYFVREFRRRGWDVDVLVPIQPNRHEKITIGDFGERIMRLKFYTVPRSMFFEAFSTLIGTLNLIRKMDERRYDVAIATVPPHDTALIAYSLRLLGRAARFVVDIRGGTKSLTQDLYSYYGVLSRLQTLLSNINIDICHKLIKRADMFVAITDGFAKFYSKLLRRKVEVVYNGADFKLFSGKASTLHDSQERGVLQGVFVGDLGARYQEVDLILRATSLLAKSEIKLKLTIVGDGKYRGYYEKMAKNLQLKDHVDFVGRVPYSRLPQIMAQADFGISGRPNVFEWSLTVPTKVYEYISAGLPVFAFGPKNSDLKYLIEQYSLGIYVASDDAEDIARALKRFLTVCRKIDRTKILKIASHFDRREWARRMANLIEGLAVYK